MFKKGEVCLSPPCELSMIMWYWTTLQIPMVVSANSLICKIYCLSLVLHYAIEINGWLTIIDWKLSALPTVFTDWDKEVDLLCRVSFISVLHLKDCSYLLENLLKIVTCTDFCGTIVWNLVSLSCRSRLTCKSIKKFQVPSYFSTWH